MTDKTKHSQGSKTAEAKLTPFQEYFYVNLIFWGFLLAAAALTWFLCGAVWDDVMSGTLEFLFVILGGGFTLVSALDYFYDKNFRESAAEGKQN